MATVVRINYHSTLSCVNNISSTPEWEIIYSFNPPDDSNPDPITGVFRTRQIPQFISEGVLIPILYITVPEHKAMHNQTIVPERVFSRPYPIPFCDSLFNNTDNDYMEYMEA